MLLSSQEERRRAAQASERCFHSAHDGQLGVGGMGNSRKQEPLPFQPAAEAVKLDCSRGEGINFTRMAISEA